MPWWLGIRITIFEDSWPWTVGCRIPRFREQRNSKGEHENLWSPPFLQHWFLINVDLPKSIRRHFRHDCPRFDEFRTWWAHFSEPFSSCWGCSSGRYAVHVINNQSSQNQIGIIINMPAKLVPSLPFEHRLPCCDYPRYTTSRDGVDRYRDSMGTDAPGWHRTAQNMTFTSRSGFSGNTCTGRSILKVRLSTFCWRRSRSAFLSQSYPPPWCTESSGHR